MLPKDRVIAALEFRTPDRIPTGEIGIDFALTEDVLGHPTLYRAKWREYTAILAAGNAVMVGVKPKNYLAMMRAARSYCPGSAVAARPRSTGTGEPCSPARPVHAQGTD